MLSCTFAFGGNLYYPISSFGLIFSAALAVVHMHTSYTHTALTIAVVETFIVVVEIHKNRKIHTEQRYYLH